MPTLLFLQHGAFRGLNLKQEANPYHLLDNRLTDSCWSVESTRDIQLELRWSHHIEEDFEARLATLCIIHSFSGSNALTAPPHHGWDTIRGQFLTLLFRQLFHTVLLGMA